MASAVLDSSAILAVLNAEPGVDVVESMMDDALVSTVNYAEVVAKLVERGGTVSAAQAALQSIALTTVDFDVALALRTGGLRGETPKRGVSLGDRACLALAEREGVPALTGDRSWVGAVSRVEVRLIR
ncbi:MAG: type II toxin-antitoxin system VapC family toxin [Xanthobacteraceae bacterium]